MHRLVLGDVAGHRAVLDRLVAGPDSLVVCLDDEDRVATLRDEGIDARHVDPTEPGTVRTVAGPIESVVVLPDGPERTVALLEGARAAYPDAVVLACLEDADDATAARARELADRVLDVADEAADALTARAGDAGVRTRRLQATLRGIEGTLGVFTHDNPDPDAIAAAEALRRIAEHAGTPASVCYYGDIDHQENRALVNLLEFDLLNLPGDAAPGEFDGIALVDHARPGVNNGLPPDTPVDVVIDHHPPRAPVEARFVDLRSEVGATSTLLAGYLDALGIEPDGALATALVYGIRTDTRGFSRGLATADFEAATTLVERADADALQQIESPSVSAETLEVLADAVANRRVEDAVLTTGVGAIGDRDALAQAADRLLELAGVETTLVFGYTDGTVYVSGRSSDATLDLGEVLREAYGRIGSAGGHADMAGAQLPVGMLLEDGDETDRDRVIEAVVTDRFYDAMGVQPDRAAALVYADFLGTDDAWGGAEDADSPD